MIGINKMGEEIILSTKTIPETPILVVTFSEKRGDYSVNNIQPKLSKVSTNYNFNIQSIYVKHNYDDGWFLGDMEIYLKVKFKEGVNGTYGGWSEIDLGQVAANSAKTFSPNITLVSRQVEEFYVKIEIWEDDGWGSGDDDFVADEYYDDWRLGTQPYGPWGGWLGAVSEFPYIRQGAYGNDISTVDGSLGSTDYDTMCLTKD
jgi:hypothetical protein